MLTKAMARTSHLWKGAPAACSECPVGVAYTAASGGHDSGVGGGRNSDVGYGSRQ